MAAWATLSPWSITILFITAKKKSILNTIFLTYTCNFCTLYRALWLKFRFYKALHQKDLKEFVLCIQIVCTLILIILINKNDKHANLLKTTKIYNRSKQTQLLLNYRFFCICNPFYIYISLCTQVHVKSVYLTLSFSTIVV